MLRVPFLFAVDEVESFFARSEYLTPHGGPVEAYHLSAPLLALDYLTGKKPTVSCRVPDWHILRVISGVPREPHHHITASLQLKEIRGILTSLALHPRPLRSIPLDSQSPTTYRTLARPQRPRFTPHHSLHPPRICPFRTRYSPRTR